MTALVSIVINLIQLYLFAGLLLSNTGKSLRGRSLKWKNRHSWTNKLAWMIAWPYGAVRAIAYALRRWLKYRRKNRQTAE